MKTKEINKKSTDFKFHCTIEEDDSIKRIFISAYHIEFRIVLDENNKATVIQAQAAFEYEEAKTLVSLGLFPVIRLPKIKKEENCRLYIYLHDQDFTCGWFNFTKKKYPYLSLEDVILYQEPTRPSHLSEIQGYDLLEWKISKSLKE